MGDRVVWESVTTGEGGQPNRKVRLVMSDQRLDEYDWTGPADTDEPVGPTVTVIAGSKEPNALLHDKARHDLTPVMALYLTKYLDENVSSDGKLLTVSALITEQVDIALPSANAIGTLTERSMRWRGQGGV